MKTIRMIPVMLLAALFLASCTSSDGTEVTARVAPNFAQEGLSPGDPLAGAVVHLYDGNDIVFEAVLDGEGSAVIEPEPGLYDVQVTLVSQQDSLCFWGETLFGVEFPSSSTVDLEAGFICAGG